MARHSRPTELFATRGDFFRRQIDSTSLSATHLDILDTLALANSNQDKLREGLPIDELFKQVAPGIWGHAAVAAAQMAGLKARDNDELVRLGQRPYFEQCLQRLLDEKAVIESDGVVKLAKVRIRVRGQVGQNAYLPGVAKRQQRRRNLSDQATALLQADRGDGLRDLFPPMSSSQFEELVLSMQTEGYDDTKPIVRDVNTKQVVDGFHRLEAAVQARVEPKFADRPFKDDLDRVRFAIRSNLIRRHMIKSERDELVAKLAARHLSTREIARMLGVRPSDSAHLAETAALSKRKTSKPRPDSGGTRFGKSDRARWGSEDRKHQAERDALAMNARGLTWVRIGELLYQQYDLDKPLSQGTVWTMAKRARLAQSGPEAEGDEAGNDMNEMIE